MVRNFKTRGDVISSYADAFRKDPTFKKSAEILCTLVEKMESSKYFTENQKIICLAEEIDNILCGYAEQRKGAINVQKNSTYN